MSRNDQPEFDKYAGSYGDLHARSIAISGEEPGYFARYKVEEVVRTSQVVRSSRTPSVLDFGCGIGGSIPDFRALLPAAGIVGVDVSEESLAIARSRNPDVRFERFDGLHLPFEDGTFDLAFTSCVFHHIDPVDRGACLAEIRRVLRPGGEFFFFEHNPWNPLTLRVVRDCPFDENAILLKSPEAVALIGAAGFSSPRVSYTVFFPRALAALRPIERFLRGVPVGGQYYVRANA
jgi:SAM-dependent methyltransferase